MYEHFWDLKDPETVHITVENKGLEEISLVPNELVGDNENEKEDAVYVVTIPRYKHREVRCREAKEEELSRFDEFDEYMKK